MKIIGNNRYKDFFDQMVYTYGVDEGIILDRTIYKPETFKSLKLNSFVFVESDTHDWYHSFGVKEKNDDPRTAHRKLRRDIFHGNDSDQYDVFYMYFNEKVYAIYYTKEIQNGRYAKINEKTVNSVYKGKLNFWCDFESDEPRTNTAPEEMIKFSKENKIPYFMFTGDFYHFHVIDSFVPIQAINKHMKYFDITEMYQYIENFIMELVLEESEQSNENKITAHGFDLKTSFRNM